VSPPKGLYRTRDEAVARVMEDLSRDYYLNRLAPFLETQELVESEEGVIVCELPNDKATLRIPLFRPRKMRYLIDQYIQGLLSKHLSEVFRPREIRIDARDIDSLAMLEDVRLEISRSRF